MEQLSILGYEIFVAKGSAVNTKLLDQPLFREAVEERIKLMLESPDNYNYRQRNELHFIRRGRVLDVHRVYLRIHHAEKIAIIAGFIGRSVIKRDERSGALDYWFIEHLKRFEKLGFVAIERLHVLELLKRQQENTFFYRSPNKHYKVNFEPMSQETADQILSSFERLPSAQPFIYHVLDKIRNNWGGRILIDLISEGLAIDVDDLKNKRIEIAAHLKKIDMPWRVLYDGISCKLMLVPLDEIRFYAQGIRGGHFLMKRKQ